jgi:hypothetical protein
VEAAAPRVSERPTLLEAAAIAVAISTVLNAIGVFTEEAIHWLNLFIGFIIATVAAGIVFGWFTRRASRPEVPAGQRRSSSACSRWSRSLRSGQACLPCLPLQRCISGGAQVSLRSSSERSRSCSTSCSTPATSRQGSDG